ncbi:MAG: transketolase C-terminal domain-containing protein [Geminicoccaceae bacterium]
MCRSRSASGPIVRNGKRVAIRSPGHAFRSVLHRPMNLLLRGISVTVADARFAKPIDRDLIRDLARRHELLLTVEAV